MILHRPGQVPYERALSLQDAARARVLGGGDHELFLLEHSPVVTLGRRGGDVDVDALTDLDTPIVPTDRGGQATWHGPGQVVGYPIFSLQRLKRTVPQMVAALGEAMATVCHEAGVPGARYDDACPGVYVQGRKLGSIGLHVHRGVITHGLALNVNNDLAGFLAIVPCGRAGLRVTTLAAEGGTLSVGDVIARLAELLDPAAGQARRVA